MVFGKIFKIILLVVVILVLLIFSYFFIGSAPVAEKITWGVDFSQMQAEALKLDWKKTYLAILEDLGVKHIKLHTQWDFVEGKKDDYYFKDIDWQVMQAQKHGADIIYVVGMKTGRWPECHIPDWATGISKQDQQDQILQYIEKVVNRYKNSNAIKYWQVENEPFFKFGECPWYDKDFLVKEVALVKSLDSLKPVIISDSGEQSFWLEASFAGDIVGSTLYRKLWVGLNDKIGFYAKFPLPSVFYWRRAQLIRYFFDKEVIGVELQSEPWANKPFFLVSLKEQEKTMNLELFKENIQYAKNTGFNKFYFWGVEWWYWSKEIQNQPEIWNEAKNIF